MKVCWRVECVDWMTVNLVLDYQWISAFWTWQCVAPKGHLGNILFSTWLHGIEYLIHFAASQPKRVTGLLHIVPVSSRTSLMSVLICNLGSKTSKPKIKTYTFKEVWLINYSSSQQTANQHRSSSRGSMFEQSNSRSTCTKHRQGWKSPRALQDCSLCLQRLLSATTKALQHV